MIERVAYLAMHTSPLLQPGVGDAGGMNVYVNELACTMADRGIDAVVFTRRTHPDQPPSVEVRQGYRVIHVDAGPPRPLPIANLGPHVAEYGEVERHLSGVSLSYSMMRYLPGRSSRPIRPRIPSCPRAPRSIS